MFFSQKSKIETISFDQKPKIASKKVPNFNRNGLFETVKNRRKSKIESVKKSQKSQITFCIKNLKREILKNFRNQK